MKVKKHTKIERLILTSLILLSVATLIMAGEVLWNIIDPFDKRTDPAPIVYILNNSYHSNRYSEKIEEERIGVLLGVVKKKTIFSPNKNGESNHLEKGIEFYEIIGEERNMKIAVKYEEEYYEYIDAPWD